MIKTRLNKGPNRWIKFNSLRFIIAIACIIVSLIPMVLIGISYYNEFDQTIVENTKLSSEQTLKQLKINIEAYLESGITATSEVNKVIINAYDEENGFDMIEADISEKLNAYYSASKDVYSIALYDEEMTLLHMTPDINIESINMMHNQSLVEQLPAKSFMYFISKPHIQTTLGDNGKWVISFVKKLEMSHEEAYYLVVDMSMAPLKNLMQNLSLSGSGYVYVQDDKSNIIYHPQQALISSGIKEEVKINTKENLSGKIYTNYQNKKDLITFMPVDFSNWDLVGVTHIEVLGGRKSEFLKEMALTIPLVLIIIVLVSIYISQKISNPIMQLESHMKKVQRGNFDAKIDLKSGEEEVMALANTFNVMVVKIKDLIHQNEREQELKRESELNALQSQINPHFLYNTLDSIVWMAESGDNEAVVKMVTSLARFFRISISKGQKTIPLKEEIEHAKNYMQIQKIRYKDKFDFTIECDETFNRYHTIKLVLQPIIENALYHGIEYMVDEGMINITVKIENNQLMMIIEDDGLGMDEETLQGIRKKLLNTDKGQASSIGLYNVHERVQLLYGKSYGVSIDSEQEEGTIVTITQPVIIREEE